MTIPELTMEMDIKVQEAQRVPNNVNPKSPTPRHIRVRISNIKAKDS